MQFRQAFTSTLAFLSLTVSFSNCTGPFKQLDPSDLSDPMRYGDAKGQAFTGEFASIENEIARECEDRKKGKRITSILTNRDDVKIRQRNGLIGISFGEFVFSGPVYKDGSFLASGWKKDRPIEARMEGHFESNHVAKVEFEQVMVSVNDPNDKRECVIRGQYHYVRKKFFDGLAHRREQPYLQWEYQEKDQLQKVKSTVGATPRGYNSVVYHAVTHTGLQLDLRFPERPDTPGLYIGSTNFGGRKNLSCDVFVESVRQRHLLGYFHCGQNNRTRQAKVKGNFVAPIPSY